MNDEVSSQAASRCARDHLLRKLIVRAILELETEVADDEREKFNNFKASTVVRLFSMKASLHDAVPFDSEFYTERVVPKLTSLLGREFASLEKLDACTENDVADAYTLLRKEIEELVQRQRALSAQIQASKELLNKTLRHEQWPLRFKLQQAEVDYTTVAAAIYEKKFATVAKSIVDLFRTYQYDEAVEAVRHRLETEKAELERELEQRIKKHEIYKKALALNPDLDNLLEKYQSITDAVINMQKMSLGSQ